MTLPILTLVVKRVSDVSEEQKIKARSPNEVTLAGIVIVVSDLHPIKARKSILVTLEGIITDVSGEHHAKAFVAIEVVLLLKLIVQGVPVHRLQQPLPSLLAHVG